MSFILGLPGSQTAAILLPYFNISGKQERLRITVLAKISCAHGLRVGHMLIPEQVTGSRLGDCEAQCRSQLYPSILAERWGGGDGGRGSFQWAIGVSLQQEGDVYPETKIFFSFFGHTWHVGS